MKSNISRDTFAKLAARKVEKASGGEKTVPVRVSDVSFDLIPKEVKGDKSLGFTVLGKVLVPVEIDGETFILPCQLSGHCTVIGTKPAEEKIAA